MKYVGVDIGKKRCRAAIMNDEGLLVDEFSFNFFGVDRFVSRISAGDRVIV